MRRRRQKQCGDDGDNDGYNGGEDDGDDAETMRRLRRVTTCVENFIKFSKCFVSIILYK